MRLLPSGSPRHRPVYHRPGELHRPSGPWQVGHLSHHDDFLCATLLRLAAAVSRQRPTRPYRRRVRSGRCADRAVHDLPEPVAQRRSATLLGNLPQHPLCPAGSAGDCTVLSQYKGAQGQGVPLDMADHCAEL